MRTFDADYVNHNNHRKHAEHSNNRVSMQFGHIRNYSEFVHSINACMAASFRKSAFECQVDISMASRCIKCSVCSIYTS